VTPEARARELGLTIPDFHRDGYYGGDFGSMKSHHTVGRVLYLSGHDRATLGPLGVPEDGPAFLKKPFTLDALVERVSGALSR